MAKGPATSDGAATSSTPLPLPSLPSLPLLPLSGRPVRLWDEDLVLSEAQEVLLWHEALPGQLLEGEGLLERRLLEYCCLGDFATAVAFLLSTPPEDSVRWVNLLVHI